MSSTIRASRWLRDWARCSRVLSHQMASARFGSGEPFRLREMGQDPDSIIDFKFQNVTFVLNILDSLAGDDRFVIIRVDENKSLFLGQRPGIAADQRPELPGGELRARRKHPS